MLSILAFSCPLILAATGALFSEYTGCLALFLDGFISLSGFLTFAFTTATGSVVSGIILSSITVTITALLFALIVEKTKANRFIAAIALNLLAGALTTLFSSLIFKTRGVLVSTAFNFAPKNVSIFAVIITTLLTATAILYLKKAQTGKKFFGESFIPIALAYADDDMDKVNSIVEKYAEQCGEWIKKDWKRNIGIMLACEDEDNDSLRYPIKITRNKKANKEYSAWGNSYATQ